MFNVLGFYKFKKLKSLKKNKLFLQKIFTDNDIKGTLIISSEGLNGAISGRSKNISLISNELKTISEQCKNLRIDKKEPTLPVTIGDELNTNIFLRCDVSSVKESLGMKNSSELEIFKKLRDLKDSF